MADINIDVRGETCPVPLVEMRKAHRKASPGDRIIIRGTHAASKKEIPMAAEALSVIVESIEENEDEWIIVIRK
ncbi:TusA-related sulfurtransferase [Dethiosulfatibacter aminovorans DSM 17477]|uniref:TusA-related sulfurtransferase n=1 Tax=Dethiosulfatibacter aminovorans DSM 17477 TaxID=1121476 RepID=A0A1M6F824_9FIRM|nr:sulfurtransferase TusA family protein [Dethiosulfatibacter aminovorans]SHI93739.1 TusA-related sulfurtransferase [Dethiosulfatibacter aminovorans DSM 17477]